MNKYFNRYIESSKSLASKKGIIWETPTDPSGRILSGLEWNLSDIAGVGGNSTIWITSMAVDKKTRQLCISKNKLIDNVIILTDHWQDLIKSIVVQKLIVDRNKPSPVKNSIIRPLTALAFIANGKEPWLITSRDVTSTFEILSELQPSGKLAKDLFSSTRVIFDQNRLSDYLPISPPRQKSGIRQRKSTQEVRQNLTQRKTQEKLPEEDAFWEITRIVWSETPQTSFDYARFCVIKLLIICGIRISEAAAIPHDCIKWTDLLQNLQEKDIPKQAIKRSLSIKYFASKKHSQRNDSIALFLSSQQVPTMFEEAVLDAVSSFSDFSKPLRERLRAQCETGRIFPEFEPDAILPALDFYPRLTGEPFVYEDPEEAILIEKWRKTYDLEVLDHIEKRQKDFRRSWELKNKVRQYFQMRLRIKHPDGHYVRAPFLHASGHPNREARLRYEELYFNVAQLEAFLRECMPTKLSDTLPMTLKDGRQLHPYELLFLAPKRALAEERNGMICDIRKYAFVGTLQPSDVVLSLSGTNKSTPTMFKKYGVSESKKELKILSHDFRHLQNTELFRLGVSDTIITKRFNRNSVQQSYVYDHRSLAEELKAVTIPEEARSHLFGKAGDTYRMIVSGLANGPIVDEFKSIQREQGDIEAFKFLSIEADGLHTTPYGHCINSFTVDPCPKHLECFSGCIHLTRSPLTEQTENLITMKGRLEDIVDKIDSHPGPIGAKRKMKEHTEARIASIEKMLETPAWEKVFPDGIDLSRPIKTSFTGPFNE